MSWFDAGIEVFDLCAEGVYLLQQKGGELCVVVVEAAGERIDKGGVLDPQPSLGQIREHPRVAFPGDQRFDHCPAGHAHHLRGDRRDLDQRVLQQFLQPLHLAGAVSGQVEAQPGVVTQLADLQRRDERGPQHAALVELGQPHRIELVRFGSAGDMLHVAGVHQPHRQAPRV